MSMKKLIELCEEKFKEEIGDYYIISKSRMDNILNNITSQADTCKSMSNTIQVQAEMIRNLQIEILAEKEE